ncbi:MAG: ABC transporter substrate-binding protein, partial [Solirubrobacteraceae bacterium]
MRRAAAIKLLAATLLLAVLGAAGCGTTSGPRPATLVLDFTPNPVHVGIYTALARGFDRAAGVALHVISPSASTDSIRLLEAGRAEFAILDIHDLAIARERGDDIVGILPIVERPLAAVIAAPGISNPRQLAGRTVGVTGAPSDTAVLDSIVSGAGGRPSSLHTVTIGYDAVSDLLAGRVAAATAFWSDEGVTLARRRGDRAPFHVFRVDEYGAPSYPELVVCATARLLRARPGLARAVVHALVRGYD